MQLKYRMKQGSVAGPVIQATGRLDFEYRIREIIRLLFKSRAIFGLSNFSKDSKFQSSVIYSLRTIPHRVAFIEMLVNSYIV